MDTLDRMIRERRANILTTERFLTEHGTELTADKLEALTRHLSEMLMTLRDMEAEYRNITGNPLN